MFDNYVAAKSRKLNTWVGVLVAVSVSVHAFALGAVVVRSYWVIEKLPVPDSEASFVSAPPPPPPPPPASKKKEKIENKKRLKKVEEPVQPVKEPPKPQEFVPVEEDEGVDDGVEGGSEDGLVGGVLGGLDTGTLGDQKPPPPPVVEKPRDVTPQALKAQRTEGEEQISPPDEVKNQIRRDGKSTITAVMKICLNGQGGVASVKQLKSSGYDAYDQKIKSKMRAWQYRPFMVDGKPTPVCSSVTFIYKQTN